MTTPSNLPADYQHMLEALEDSYLQSDDPLLQSGFGGGPERWRAEREPILQALEGDGDFLDIGCANDYLLECLVAWAAARGVMLTPYGLDLGPRLVALAQQRWPQLTGHFVVANAWGWQPPRKFRYVYALADNVPADYVAAYASRLFAGAVTPGGRLILGSYGSRSRQLQPVDVGAVLEQAGQAVAGTAQGGDPPMARFAWAVKQG